MSLSLFLAALLCFTCLFFTWSEQPTVNQPLWGRQVSASDRVCSSVYEVIHRPSARGHACSVDFLFASGCLVLYELTQAAFPYVKKTGIVPDCCSLFLSQDGARLSRGRTRVLCPSFTLPHRHKQIVLTYSISSAAAHEDCVATTWSVCLYFAILHFFFTFLFTQNKQGG